MELAELFVSLLLDNSEYTKAINDEVNNASTWGSTLGKNFLSGAAVITTGILAIIGTIGALGIASFNMANEVNLASKDIQTSLGVTEERADELSGVVTNIFGEGFFNSINDASNALIFVRQTVGNLADNELQRITTQSQKLADTFDEDFNSIASSAQTLVETGLVDNFDEAFDLITTGFQSGLNRSDDFLDSIQEYSGQFSDAGATGQEFFSLLETGLAGGVLGTDKAADLFKEFTLRISDGSKSTEDALTSLGLSSDEITKGLQDGSLRAIDVFNDISSAIRFSENNTEAFNAGVALLGTQFEDLGITAFESIDTLSDTFYEVEGATDSLGRRYDNLGDVFEVGKRQFMLAILPIGNALLRIANLVIPIVEDAFNRFRTFITPIIERISRLVDLFFTEFLSSVQDGQGLVTSFINGLFNAFDDDSNVLSFITSLETFLNVVRDIVNFIASQIINFVSWKDVLIGIGIAVSAIVVPAVISLIASLLPIIAPILLIIGAVALLRNIWKNNFLGIRDIVISTWENNIKPALEQLQIFIIETVIPAVQEFWDKWVNVYWPAIRDVLIAVWQNVIQPILTSIGGFIRDTLLPILDNLWQKWVNEIWPAIQTKLTEVWAIIQPILQEAWRFFSEDLIPILENFRVKWIEEIWPNIQTALTNAWTIISEILIEFNRWFEENLIPIIQELQRIWVEEFWPAIQEALETAWEVIEEILLKISDWFGITLLETTEEGGIAWADTWTKIGSAISDVWNNTISGIFTAIENFWNWLTSADFSFNISIPDLPDWMIPGSPIPLHTAWENFGKFINRQDFTPTFNNIPSVAPLPATAGIQDTLATSNNGNVTLVMPNVTNENAVKSSVAAIERIRTKKVNNFINR